MRIAATQDQRPQLSEGFITYQLHYDSQDGPLGAQRELPDARPAATSSPTGACDLRLAWMIRAADARDGPAAAGSLGRLPHHSSRPPESLCNQWARLRQGPQEAVTVGRKGKFLALAGLPQDRDDPPLGTCQAPLTTHAMAPSQTSGTQFPCR